MSIDSDKIQYHSVSADETNAEVSSTEDACIPLEQDDQKPVPRSWSRTIMLQLLTTLWLVPVITLLRLNYIGHRIGASVWCPKGSCNRAFFTSSSVEQAKKLDRSDHNVLGALQLVAKALEAWFVCISAALLYLVTIFMAGRKEGLPIGYLTKSTQFASPATLTESLPWPHKTAAHAVQKSTRKWRAFRLWLFVLLSVLLFVLCNLMGPAAAVLVIPILQWVENARYGYGRMESINYESPPHNGSWINTRSADCGSDGLFPDDYTCTQDPIGNYLDAWIVSSMVTIGDSTGFADQDLLKFQLNDTIDDDVFEVGETSTRKYSRNGMIWWAPNRPTIERLSASFGVYRIFSWDGLVPPAEAGSSQAYRELYTLYSEYNRSLELEMRVNGPTIGAIPNLWMDYDDLSHRTVTQIDSDRQVRCYSNYDISWTPAALGTAQGNFTKCIRAGAGWNEPSIHQQEFSINGRSDPNVSGNGLQAELLITSSDKAVFFPNGQMPAWFDNKCLVNNWSPGNLSLNYSASSNLSRSCNWTRLFETDNPAGLYNRSRNVVTMEYSMESEAGIVDLAIDFTAFLAFVDYVLDISPVSNAMRVVRTEGLPISTVSEDVKPIFVHPSWLLAGWSAESGAALSDRPATDWLVLLLDRLLSAKDAGLRSFKDDTNLNWIPLLPVMQAFSIIDHTYGGSPNKTGGRLEGTDSDKWHPIAYETARMLIWAYGFKSRTSIFGAVIAVFGCVVVLTQAIVGCLDRRKYRSPTQLLVAALEHTPDGEFDGKGHSERKIAATHLRVTEDDSRAGKFSFYKP